MSFLTILKLIGRTALTVLPPALGDGGTGLWLVSTSTARWMVDLDARVVRHPVDGMEDVHTPGQAWLLMALTRCVVGEQLEWVRAASPARMPLPAQRGINIVPNITPVSRREQSR